MKTSPLAPRLLALAAALLIAACASSQQAAAVATTQDGLQRTLAATEKALQCRAANARNPAYAVLQRHMPLANIGMATLPQMTDRSHASTMERAALDSWIRDENDCRQHLLEAIDGTLPSFGPILEAGRDDDDAVYVGLAQRRLTWGEAVMRLRANRTRLRAAMIARGDKVLSEVSRMQQAQLDRRTAILSSVIRILP